MRNFNLLPTNNQVTSFVCFRCNSLYCTDISHSVRAFFNILSILDLAPFTPWPAQEQKKLFFLNIQDKSSRDANSLVALFPSCFRPRERYGNWKEQKEQKERTTRTDLGEAVLQSGKNGSLHSFYTMQRLASRAKKK